MCCSQNTRTPKEVGQVNRHIFLLQKGLRLVNYILVVFPFPTRKKIHTSSVSFSLCLDSGQKVSATSRNDVINKQNLKYMEQSLQSKTNDN